MIQKLKYWLFQRGKGCKHCCLWCEYYDLCSNEVMSSQKQKARRENEKL